MPSCVRRRKLRDRQRRAGRLLCWEESNVDTPRLDPVLMNLSERRRAQKERFGGELFPATMPADPGYADFRDYFQHELANNAPKGIVAIDLKDLP
jgi:hypothetical protein